MLLQDVIQILAKTVAPDIELRGVSVYQTKAGVSVTVYTDDGKREENTSEHT